MKGNVKGREVLGGRGKKEAGLEITYGRGEEEIEEGGEGQRFTDNR